jgi:hypothetical protein
MRVLASSLLLVGMLTGCGPDCRSSCEKLYGDAAGECNINVASASGEQGAAELVRDCSAQCEDAMSKTGELGDYDPNVRGSADSVTLQNEVQAAAWMECIVETSCDNLGDGYCPPHYR